MVGEIMMLTLGSAAWIVGAFLVAWFIDAVVDFFLVGL